MDDVRGCLEDWSSSVPAAPVFRVVARRIAFESSIAMHRVIPAYALLRGWAPALFGCAAGLNHCDGIGKTGYQLPHVLQCGHRRAAGDVWLLRRGGRRSDRQLSELRQAVVGSQGQDHAHVDRKSLSEQLTNQSAVAIGGGCADRVQMLPQVAQHLAGLPVSERGVVQELLQSLRF
ncbi:hypothetical protein MRX96_059274 [Rhipicephalus microplus]